MEDVSYLRVVVAFVFVLSLLGLCGLLARKLQSGSLARKLGAGRRLQISEQLYVDSKRKLMLVRCDEREHLLLIGPEGAQRLEGFPAPIERSGGKVA